MTDSDSSAIGNDVVIRKHGADVVFKNYMIDREAHTERLKSVDTVLDISISIAEPVSKVWAVYKDFNSWMSRFGYVWDRLPADHENEFRLSEQLARRQ